MNGGKTDKPRTQWQVQGPNLEECKAFLPNQSSSTRPSWGPNCGPCRRFSVRRRYARCPVN
jgi:hypothetical protein